MKILVKGSIGLITSAFSIRLLNRADEIFDIDDITKQNGSLEEELA